MTRILSLTVIFSVVFLALASNAAADVPTLMQYQGFLTDEAGEPMHTTVSMTFTIYDNSTGSGVIWTETQDSVIVDNGLFNVLLGSVNPISDTVFSDTVRWLGITVAPDPEITPRTRLVTVPYAFRTATADGATGGLISGDVFQADSEGDTICQLSRLDEGGGYIAAYGANGSANAVLTIVEGYPNNGGVGILNSGSEFRAEMFVSAADDVGIVRTRGPNGNRNARFTYLIDHPDNGFVEVSNSLGIDRGNFYVNDSRAGMVILQGPNNTHNVVMRSVEDAPYPNGGSVGVCDHDGWMRAELAVISSGQGIVQGDTKNFRVANPNEPGKDIWYCCLEGPEAAAYVRGTGHLVGGRAQVTLPDHFVAVASQQGITVQVTPLSAESKGLTVVEKSSEMFAVRELNNGNGTYDFDFMVTAVRKEHEDYKVIRPAMKMQPPELGAAPDGFDIQLQKISR
ncbi:MAG: hypothetical protein AMJ73_05800 [candidate division Zixibacteria bacterium SM1_73]|nr:MAG: hypothetical protein AMJ73_05800 [candidate division Zixibacteria bacterium SM1_73]